MTVRNMSFKDARFFIQIPILPPSLISGSSFSVSKSLFLFLQSENNHVYRERMGDLNETLTFPPYFSCAGKTQGLTHTGQTLCL